MKSFIFLSLLYLAAGAHAQSSKFIETWDFFHVQVQKIDSQCTLVREHDLHPRQKRTKIRVYKKSHPGTYHKIFSKYRSGHYVVAHKCKSGGGKEITFIEIDGRLMSVDIEWGYGNEDLQMSSGFTRLADSTWIWTYHSKQSGQTRFDGQKQDFVETVSGWPH